MVGPSGTFARQVPHRVWLYTREQVYLATLHLFPQQRLLDLLNDQRNERRLFLPLTDVQIQQRAGSQGMEAHPFVALNYRAICLAGETGAIPPTGVSSVPKHRVAVRLEMESGVALTGTVHCAPAERVIDILNREERFLPVTDATILLAAAEGEASLPFVAVNRQRIVRALELRDGGGLDTGQRPSGERPPSS